MSEFLNIPEIFGSDVFNERTMQQRLAPQIYEAWKTCMRENKPLQLDVANEIAEAMKNEEVKEVLGH